MLTTDPIMAVRLPQSQLAALQAAGQLFLEAKPHSSIAADVAAGIEALDAPYQSEQADEILLIGSSPEPDSRTLAECLSALDGILARVQVFRSAVQRLPGDRELTVVRLDTMAGDLRDAIQSGDRAMASWKAGS